MTLSPVSIRERKWIDIDTRPFDQYCFAVSKAMIRFLLHGASVPREDDGAVRFDDLVKEFEAKFDGTSQWPINDWIKGFNTASTLTLPNYSCISEQFRDIQETVSLILHCKTVYGCRRTSPKYIYHVGNVSQMYSIINSGLKRERQSVFFTAVNPMDDDQSME